MAMKRIEDYPVQQYSAFAPDDITWIFDGEWSILDNFAPTPVHVDIGWGVQDFPTSEHAFAAAKARRSDDADFIRISATPGIAKERGRKTKLRPDWETVKAEMMWRILVAKFEQNPEALTRLKATGRRRIFEGNYWGDWQWGVIERRGQWYGRNMLGFMLMQVRDEVNG